MRFSRTRLTDIVHRLAYAAVASGANGAGAPLDEVAAGDMANEGVATAVSVLLSAAVEHALEGTSRVHTDHGVADGTSRQVGTHQGSSLWLRASMKCGPFAPGGLCCPADHHYYGPLRLPLGSSTISRVRRL
jgi:hypothetical protein